MEATWDLMFTEHFKKDVDKFSLKNIEKYLGKIELLKKNPYSRNSNVKHLKGSVAHRFRLRIGKIRVIYRVLASTRKVQLLRIAFRKNVYEPKRISNEDSIGFIDELYPSDEIEKSHELNGIQDRSANLAPSSSQEVNQAVSEDTVLLEEITGLTIDRDELFLIGIPEKYHDRIISANSLKESGIEKSLIKRIEDYLTNPESTHVGKLYSLEGDSTFVSIANQSFLDFVVELDPQQLKIVRDSLKKGPFMVRGGPGTGKTLICLERLRRFCKARVTETLFSKEQQTYLFVSYTNSLVDASREILDKLLPSPQNTKIIFSTLDHIVTTLAARETVGTLAKIPNINRLRAILVCDIIKPMESLRSNDLIFRKLIASFSHTFFLEEFDSVINGNCLTTLEDYLTFKRVGRKVALQKKQREVIWEMFTEFNIQLDKKRLSTWGRRRLDLWKALESGRFIPRKKANVLVIDEVQDLSVCAVKILLHLAVDPRFVMFAADSGQSIYSKSPVSPLIKKQLNFKKGNSFILKRSYRMTKQISTAIQSLRCDSDNKDPVEMDSNVPFTGPNPHWIELEEALHDDFVVEEVERLIKDKKIHPGQIGIISRTRRQLSDLRTLFSKQGIATNMVAKENPVNLTERAVHLLTVHSAKGMEFPFVFVPYVTNRVFCDHSMLDSFQDENEKKEFLDSESRLLYVALSRAARELWMLVDPQNPSLLLAKVSKENWNIS